MCILHAQVTGHAFLDCNAAVFSAAEEDSLGNKFPLLWHLPQFSLAADNSRRQTLRWSA